MTKIPDDGFHNCEAIYCFWVAEENITAIPL